jgi:hypothetical protein
MTGLETAKVTKSVKSVIWSLISVFDGVVTGVKRGICLVMATTPEAVNSTVAKNVAKTRRGQESYPLPPPIKQQYFRAAYF